VTSKLGPEPPRRRSKRTREEIREAAEARAGEWQRLLDDGVYGSRAELARAMGVSRAAVTRALRVE